MNLGFKFLEEILSKKNLKLAELSHRLNIEPQNMTAWKSKNQIPAKRVAQIAEIFDLGFNDIERLMGYEPVHFVFRTPGKEIPSENAAPELNARAQFIFEKCLLKINNNPPYVRLDEF